MEKKVDKFAYHIGNKFFCEECLTEEEAKAIREREKVTKKEVGPSEEVVCDKCNRKI